MERTTRFELATLTLARFPRPSTDPFTLVDRYALSARVRQIHPNRIRREVDRSTIALFSRQCRLRC